MFVLGGPRAQETQLGHTRPSSDREFQELDLRRGADGAVQTGGPELHVGL